MHYTRNLSLYWAQMNNLTIEEQSFMEQGLFAASMTSLPFSSIPYDQWIVMTMNKGSKMKGGWIGFTMNLCYISTPKQLITYQKLERLFMTVLY